MRVARAVAASCARNGGLITEDTQTRRKIRRSGSQHRSETAFPTSIRSGQHAHPCLTGCCSSSKGTRLRGESARRQAVSTCNARASPPRLSLLSLSVTQKCLSPSLSPFLCSALPLCSPFSYNSPAIPHARCGRAEGSSTRQRVRSAALRTDARRHPHEPAACERRR